MAGSGGTAPYSRPLSTRWKDEHGNLFLSCVSWRLPRGAGVSPARPLVVSRPPPIPAYGGSTGGVPGSRRRRLKRDGVGPLPHPPQYVLEPLEGHVIPALFVADLRQVAFREQDVGILAGTAVGVPVAYIDNTLVVTPQRP